MSTRSTRNCVVGSMLALASTGAAAAQFDYGWRVGVGHSDNIGLTTTDPISQNMLIPGFDFSYQQEGSTFQTNVVGNLEYRDYLGNAFDNQKLAQLAGQANWTVLPQRLDFTILDVASVQPLSTLSSNAPGNQQQTNVLTLGPTLRFRLNGTLRGQADLNYTNSTASKTRDFNSSRGTFALRLLKDLSPTELLSANAETERVTFDHSDAGPAYNRTRLFASFVNHLRQLDIDASLGWSRLSFGGAASTNTPLARLNLTWQMTPNSSLAFGAAHQYGDAAEDLITQLGQNPGTLPPVAPSSSNVSTGTTVIGSQVYIERRFELVYTYVGARWKLRVAPLYRNFDYVNDPTDSQRGRSGSAGLDYRLSPRTTLSAFVNTESLHYDLLQRTDRTTNFGIVLTDKRTTHWSWNVALTRSLRSSNAADASYHANEIYLGVAYRR
ncbi:hypothetical protein [Rhodanobacter sp. B05]|uniref:hypothetical protein n=1 Tax=Rhodanobacter sp. B05 TaxID=1945859 RepID=UPI00143A9C37|nr:hypothetical protein [Rhodanobacter sp. B05]